MRLLVISAAFPPMRAAEADHIFHLCGRLANGGLDVHVLTTEGNVPVGSPGVRVHPIMRRWDWTELPRLVRFLTRCAPDAILLMFIDWVYSGQPMITFSASVARRLFPNIPFVTKFPNPIGVPPGRLPLPTRLLRRAAAHCAGPGAVDYRFGTLLRDSTRLIAFCHHHLETLAQIDPAAAKKSVLIPPPPIMSMRPDDNGTSRRAGRLALGLKDTDFVVAYFGYIYPNKGVETLLKAFQTVSAQRKDARLVLIGGIIALEFPDRPSYAQEVQALPRQLGIEDSVTWTGGYAWDSEEPSLYLRAADVCVLPFDTGIQMNNSSFSAAAAHALPIITTRGPALEPVFVHGENVFLCPPKDPEALASAMTQLMDRPDLRQGLRTGVLKLAQNWFSWDGALTRTLQALTPAA